MSNKNNAPARIPGCHPGRKHMARGMCGPCYATWYASGHKEKVNETRRIWALKNPNKRKETRWQSRYGISAEMFREKVEEQGGKCAVCGARPATDVDHNHHTGAVRGILCGSCNRALGLMGESVDKMKSAIRYLEKWNDSYGAVEGAFQIPSQFLK